MGTLATFKLGFARLVGLLFILAGGAALTVGYLGWSDASSRPVTPVLSPPARPAAVNETVHKGSAVQTGTQSRSELTFQDQSITRLGEKTIFSVGGGARSIELGSGQFLLYVPKNSGGAKVKMGSVTAAITG